MDYHSMSSHQEDEKATQRVVVRWAILGKLFGLLTLILISVWIGKYHGFDWSTKLMHYHPFFMVLGMVVFYGDAIMVYRVFRGATKKSVKIAHAIMLLSSLTFASIGLYAVFADSTENVYSAHSWIGITTISLFAMQWVCGFISFLFPQLSFSVRKAYKPLHVFWGATIFAMAGAACVTGIMDYSAAITDYSEHSTEGTIANMAAVSVVAGTIVVLYVVSKPEYVRLPEEVTTPLNSTFNSVNGDKGIINYGN